MPVEGTTHETILITNELFKNRTYLLMVDGILAEQIKLMRAYDYICHTIGFFQN